MDEQLWLTKPDDVEDALVYIRKHKLQAQGDVSLQLMKEFSVWVRETLKSGVKMDWAKVWLEMGHMAHKLLTNNFKDWVEDDFKQLLIEKHKRYGIAALTGWGQLGLAIRVDSKCDRMVNLATKGMEGHDGEGLTDTVQDILGYCILGIYMSEIIRRAKDKPKLILPNENGSLPFNRMDLL